MIGRVQDIMSAAIVKGAAESAMSQSATNGNAAQTGESQEATMQGTTPAATAAKPANELQNEPSVNDVPAQQEKADDDQKMDENSVSLMTKELNELMSKINCDLRFQYHKEVDVMSVKMVDKSTDEVIKEFPPEEMVKNMIKAKEWIGAFLDRNA